MSALLQLLDLRAGDGDHWHADGSGPTGKRAFGGQFAAQTLAAAVRTVVAGALPTSLHVQFLRGGDSGAGVEYAVKRLYDGRTSMTRDVLAHQDGRLITRATVSFAVPQAGPEHGVHAVLPHDPEALPATGPAGPSPGLPLDELDIRIADTGVGTEFLRRFYWRTRIELPDDPLLHTALALYVTDVYMIDPVLRVHGHSISDRRHHSGTTDAAVWFHRPIRADEWNLLESRSSAAARGRGVVAAQFINATSGICATAVQEGLVAARE